MVHSSLIFNAFCLCSPQFWQIISNPTQGLSGSTSALKRASLPCSQLTSSSVKEHTSTAAGNDTFSSQIRIESPDRSFLLMITDHQVKTAQQASYCEATSSSPSSPPPSPALTTRALGRNAAPYEWSQLEFYTSSVVGFIYFLSVTAATRRRCLWSLFGVFSSFYSLSPLSPLCSSWHVTTGKVPPFSPLLTRRPWPSPTGSDWSYCTSAYTHISDIGVNAWPRVSSLLHNDVTAFPFLGVCKVNIKHFCAPGDGKRH